MLNSRLVLPIALLATTACTTHMRTYPDVPRSPALEGAAYRLPALQYDFVFEDRIISCPIAFALEGKTYWLGDVGLNRKATATSSYVAGERFAIDHEALTSFMKTSKYGFESYESGVLKSINTGAEDQTGPLLKSVVSVALSVYGLANPVSVATSTAAPLAGRTPDAESLLSPEQKYSKLLEAMGVVYRHMATAAGEPKRLSDGAIRKLLSEKLQIAAVCSSRVAAALAQTSDTDDFDAAVNALKVTTAEVDALKLAVASRAASNAEVVRLVNVMMRQSSKMQTVEKSKGEFDEKKTLLVMKAERRWTPTSGHWAISQSPNLKEKLENQIGYFISRKKVLEWWYGALGNDGLSTQEKDAVTKDYPDLVKVFSLEKEGQVKCDNCPDPTSVEDFQKASTSSFAMVGENLSPQDSKPDDLISGSTGRIEGLVVREPVILRLATCSSSPCSAASAKNLSADIPVPQAGAYRLLPFRNGPFEAATLSAKFQENGRMESFSYERTRAASSGADVVAEAVAKVEAFKEKREKEKQDKLTAARTEELAEVTHQISLLTKQKELAALLSSPTPAEQQSIEAETARLNAEITLLNARRSRIEAEALLVASSSSE